MVNKINGCIYIIVVSVIAGCRAYKPVSQRSLPEPDARSYIEKYTDLAISEMMRTGVPASITLAQAMIESDFGRSTLAREANNHFGIKCHNGWNGPTIKYDDDRRNECFRKYRNPEESFHDHSDFLKNGSRYQALFDLDPHDYRAWANGLKKAGYATNPDYANMLIRKIEENNLSALVSDNGSKRSLPVSGRRYIPNGGSSDASGKHVNTPKGPDSDEKKPAEPPVFNDNLVVHALIQRVQENNRVEYIVVRPDDSIDKLVREYELLDWELKKYNDIEGEMRLVPGQILYIQPKRRKAEAGKYFHTCVAGETMYTISQKYAIRLKSLYSLNRMNPGVPVHPGQKLWLRTAKPK
jgi:LysM repeat protein